MGCPVLLTIWKCLSETQYFIGGKKSNLEIKRVHQDTLYCLLNNTKYNLHLYWVLYYNKLQLLLFPTIYFNLSHSVWKITQKTHFTNSLMIFKHCVSHLLLLHTLFSPPLLWHIRITLYSITYIIEFLSMVMMRRMVVMGSTLCYLICNLFTQALFCPIRSIPMRCVQPIRHSFN